MRFREAFRFELTYQLRNRTVWLYAVALLVLVRQMVIGELAATDGTVLLNAPSRILEYMTTAGLFSLLFTAALAGDAATRDVRARMEPLLYTAPVGKWALLGGRFLAVLALNAVLMVAESAVIAVTVHTSGAAPELMVPFRAAAYTQAYLLLVLPNVAIGAVLLYAAALLSRRAVVSYVVGGILFIGAFFNVEVTARMLGHYGLAAHLDPFGVAALVTTSQSWTPIQKNTLIIPFEGWIASNRLLWLGLSVAVGLLAGRQFRLAHHVPRRLWPRPSASRLAVAHSEGVGLVPGRSSNASPVVPHVARTFGPTVRARQAVGVAGRTLRQLVAGWGWVPPLGVALMEVLVGLQQMEHLGVPLLPTTARVLAVFVDNNVPLFLTAFIVFYAGELVWADRDAHLDALVDVAPVPDGILLLGRLLGLGLAVTAMQALLAASGLTIQAFLGYTDVEPGLYLGVLFGLQLADYLLVAVLAVTVHVLVNQKYVGHLVVLLAYLFTQASGYLGVEHHLLIYGTGPDWTHTELSGFGASLYPFLLFKLYWTGWAMLLAAAASRYWVRGADHGLRQRYRRARRGGTAPAARLAAAGVILVLLAGAFVFYNTNVLNDYHSTAEQADRRVAYERQYGRYENVPQPQVTAADVRVELYPERRAATVRGTYWLVNRTGAAIDTVHLATASEVTTEPVSFDQAAEAVRVDDDLGHRIYRLARPLQPGDTLRLQFALQFAPGGFTNDGADPAVVANGTSIRTAEWLPQVGYQRSRTLQAERERAAHGLPPRPAIPHLDDTAVLRGRPDAATINVDMTIGTAADQTAIAPGTLRRTWTEGARRYFRYVSDVPIRNDLPVLSARYAVHESRWRDVAIQVFYPPGRTWDVDRITRSVQASLATYTELFGPYPYSSLKVVAAPDPGSGATAYPGLITVRDGLAEMLPDRDPRDIDFAFAVVAHEVAHQWWGQQLVPALVEGAPILTESLAWYSAMTAIEATYGEAHLRRFLDVMREAYLTPRSRADVPLLRAADWLGAYRKGPFAMYTLREYVGEARVNTALRRLLQQHSGGEPPLPTSLDLYRELRAVAPDSLRFLLADLFERNTFWELNASGATAVPVGTAVWRVTLNVRARKVAVDSAGVETEVPMDDLVEVGIFAAGEGGAPLYGRLHRVRPGEQRITVTVSQEPARAWIDPRRLLMDTEPGDNSTGVHLTP